MPHPILVNGVMVTKYQTPMVYEYVNMETGEIIPADELNDSPEKQRLTRKVLTPEQAQTPLFWELIPPPKYPRKHAAHALGTKDEAKGTAPKRKTRPSKSVANPHNALFKDCWSVKEVTESVSPTFAVSLDNILTGVCLLDQGGNTRPVSTRLILDLLRELWEISTETVQMYTGLSTSYCRKLAGLVRLAIVELNKITMEDLVSPPRASLSYR